MTPQHQIPEQQETQKPLKNPAFRVVETICTILLGLSLAAVFVDDMPWLTFWRNQLLFLPLIAAIAGLLLFKHKFQRILFISYSGFAIALIAYAHFFAS